jgi:ubiquinone/menaquinone biosynthesis C-methylase UbiE
MPNLSARSVEACLIELLQHFGIARAHVAAGRMGLTDWEGLATRHPERLASLTLVAPPPLDAGIISGLASRLLVIAGSEGVAAKDTQKLLANAPGAVSRILPGYATQVWNDTILDRLNEIGPAMLEFLGHVEPPQPPATPPVEAQGEVAGISYHIRGAGPPLVLLPLDLAPSQWEPLIPLLRTHYCTITLGGPLLGIVGVLEGRGRSGYLSMVKAVLDAVPIQPGEVILELGGGSGVILREVARRTAGANRIIDVDNNPYLLREAEQLARRAGLAENITFHHGRAEAIPLADNSVDVTLSFTVMEEGDADQMLAEMIRVTRPGGRIAAVVRATDMPSWANAPLTAAIRAKADQPGMVNGGIAPSGCADASLYQRFHRAGLALSQCFPQFVAITPAETSRLTISEQRILTALTAPEVAQWHSAVTQAKADNTFFIASSYHCAIGIKAASASR